MTNTSVTDSLKLVLADTYALYLKTQNYHWNVTGPQFRALHALFEEQYTEYAGAIDEIAERIRKLGEKVPANFQGFNERKTIRDGNENASATDMVKELVSDQQKVSEVIKSSLAQAQSTGDEVTADLMIGRLSSHDTHKWMLNAILAA